MPLLGLARLCNYSYYFVFRENVYKYTYIYVCICIYIYVCMCAQHVCDYDMGMVWLSTSAWANLLAPRLTFPTITLNSFIYTACLSRCVTLCVCVCVCVYPIGDQSSGLSTWKQHLALQRFGPYL